jgi:superfamily II DNA or RNA helicase
MNSLRELTSSGVFRPRMIGPGFGIPVFLSEAEYYVQEISSEGKVARFVRCDVDSNFIRRSTPLTAKQTVGAAGLYAFESIGGETKIGRREEIKEWLQKLIPTLQAAPFVLSDVAEFLADSKLLAEAHAQCRLVIDQTRKARALSPGQRVRLRFDVGRIGVFTGKVQMLGARRDLRIQFHDRAQWVPEDQIEVVPDDTEHPLEMLRNDRFASITDLQRALAHVRLSGRLAELIYSMETTNTDFYAYQFKPVLKMLNSPGKGILVADEVGLGKTIEAGLIWTEFQSRFDLQRLMVLCPAFLRDEKWQAELKNRFGINAQVCNAEEALTFLKETARSPQESTFALVGSMQGLRPRKAWNIDDEDKMDESSASELARFLREHKYGDPLIDLLIVDEAHYLKNPESKTAQLGRLLRDVSEYVVLLSATPIHLKSDDLYQLLNIVDEDTFDHQGAFDRVLQANAPLVKAKELLTVRMPSRDAILMQLRIALEDPLLRGSRQLSQLIDTFPTADKLGEPDTRSLLIYQLETVNLFGQVVSRTRKREVLEWKVIREPRPEMVPMTLVEQIFYDKVTALVREYCSKLDYAEGFLLVTPQRQMSSSMAAALRNWKLRREVWAESIYEDVGVDSSDVEKPGPLLTAIFREVEALGNWEELRDHDSKFDRLQSELKKLFLGDRKEKVIVFSYFIPTLDYLYDRLTESGINCIVLKGGQLDSKGSIIEAFAQPNGPSVLLSSEVGSEGIDLQFCHIIVNYDLPWNPMRIEQRIGRVDRLGQKSPKVSIWNLLYQGTIDERIYSKLYERLRIFEGALGGLEPVLGDNIQRLTFDLLSSTLTAQQEDEQIEQTAQAIANMRTLEHDLEEEASYLVAYGDYIVNQVNAAKELQRQITGEEIFRYVSAYFRLTYPGCLFEPTEAGRLLFDVSLTQQTKLDLENFIKRHQIRASTSLTRSDPSPVRCWFENKVGVATSQKVEVINQVHPVIRFVNDRIDHDGLILNPAVAIRLDRNELREDSSLDCGDYFFSVHKWSVRGLRDQERLFFTAQGIGSLSSVMETDDAEKLIMTATAKGGDWIGKKAGIDLEKVAETLASSCLELTDRAFDRYVLQLRNMNLDRADVQEKMLDQHFKNQLTKLEETKRKHAYNNRPSLVKATEGRINKLGSRVERRRLEIETRKKIAFSSSLVCVGVIRIE